jgi:hypothetical protein
VARASLLLQTHACIISIIHTHARTLSSLHAHMLGHVYTPMHPPPPFSPLRCAFAAAGSSALQWARKRPVPASSSKIGVGTSTPSGVKGSERVQDAPESQRAAEGVADQADAVAAPGE